MSKAAKRRALLNKIEAVIQEYAMCAQSWDPEQEGDYQEFIDTLDDIITEELWK